MPELTPIPLGRLAARLARELEGGDSVLDLPRRLWHIGDPGKDLSAKVHGKRASTPLGPAAGPHTQLATNIIRSWLCGARVFELKTVQILDELKIPRPCIDARTVCFNVEWSQELKLEQSLEEYVKASMLIDVLSSRVGLSEGFGDSVYDMSVGYDLKGVREPRMRAFVTGLMDARATVDRLRAELPAEWRDTAFRTAISDTVTLSTFHGCPPQEIEAIAQDMLEQGLSVSVKLNPTLLGPELVRRILNVELGYGDIRVPDEAFVKDARWEDVAAFVARLEARAKELGRGFGVKFSNTLVVDNPGDFLPGSEKTRYLSGPPLHALAMALVARFREAFGARMPISFSAGIDKANFPDAVALGLCPVTTCTDLLRPGGYGRLKGYLEELSRRMDAVGARDLAGFRAQAKVEPAAYARAAASDPRYALARNAKPPKKVGSRLVLFDCLSCDKCVSACPNGAIFGYAGSGPAEKPRQIAVFADLCNECGNCDVFCPEDGGPYKTKPLFFGSLEAWKADARDGFFVEGSDLIHGRLGGKVYLLDRRGGRVRCEPDSSQAPTLQALLDGIAADESENWARP